MVPNDTSQYAITRKPLATSSAHALILFSLVAMNTFRPAGVVSVWCGTRAVGTRLQGELRTQEFCVQYDFVVRAT